MRFFAKKAVLKNLESIRLLAQFNYDRPVIGGYGLVDNFTSCDLYLTCLFLVDSYVIKKYKLTT